MNLPDKISAIKENYKEYKKLDNNARKLRLAAATMRNKGLEMHQRYISNFNAMETFMRANQITMEDLLNHGVDGMDAGTRKTLKTLSDNLINMDYELNKMDQDVLNAYDKSIVALAKRQQAGGLTLLKSRANFSKAISDAAQEQQRFLDKHNSKRAEDTQHRLLLNLCKSCFNDKN
ncbi:MAG: hypothetical protein FWC61_00365 [Proteobacteria bacterium]|nr:hypothetical protein [Pseudomonadota bacterium]